MKNKLRQPYLTTSMSPWRHSLTSRIKKSTLGPPIPMHTIDTGVPRYLPVMVKKPRSEWNENGLGNASKYVAMRSARESMPTVIFSKDKQGPMSVLDRVFVTSGEEPYNPVSNLSRFYPEMIYLSTRSLRKIWFISGAAFGHML